MSETFKVVLSLSFSGSLLILILCLIRSLFKERLSKNWRYYIWFVVVARLLLPVAPETNLMKALFPEIEKSFEKTEAILSSDQVAVSIPEFTIYQSREAGHKQSGAMTFSANPMLSIFTVLLENLLIVWLTVALILFVRKITIYQSFLKYIRAGCIEVTDIDLLERFGNLVEQYNIKSMVELYTNNLISSPLLIGFFRPCIVLPSSNLPPDDFVYTIRHELTHYKRRDMFYKWLVQFAVCVHWFNPLVSLMSREINRDCELSCDEAIIRRLDPYGRKAYGDTLLNAMATRGDYKNSLASVTLNESKELLKERLDAIMNFKRQSRTMKQLLFILTLMICLGGAFTGVYAADPAPLQENTLGQKSSAGDIVLFLTNNGENAITKSGSFEAKDNQTLTLTIQSDIKGGSVDLFFFSPDYREQRITINSSNETKTITLSAGRWAYNCTGFFESGNIVITGTIPQYSDTADNLNETGTDEDEVIVLNLASNGQNSITRSGSFEAKDNQVLNITIQSDIKGGSVDLFLFSPDNEEMRMTVSSSDETKTIVLSAGRWAYNCTGFFESGDITIIGEKQNDLP